MRSRYHLGLPVGLVSLMTVIALACADATPVEGSNSPSPAVRSFPLSSQLPSDEFAKLRGSLEGEHKTGAFLYRVPGRDRLCLKILAASPGPGATVSVLGGSPSCKNSQAQAQRLTAALGLSDPELRLLAFGFGPEVARVQLTKASGAMKEIRARSLSASQVNDVGDESRKFKYVVVRDIPPCFDHLKTIRTDGTVVGATDLAPC